MFSKECFIITKFASLLLTAVLICTMIAFGTIYAFAEETPATVDLSSASELQNFLSSLEPEAEVSVHMTQEITIASPITITKPCTVIFEGENKFILTANCRGFYIESDSVTLNFGENSIINGNGTEFEDPGRALYIEGNHCTVSGLKFNNCRIKELGQSINGLQGGAIYVEGDYNTVTDCVFDSCFSPEDGGAVCFKGTYNTVASCKFNTCVSYMKGGAVCFYKGSNHGTVTGCTFEQCKAERHDTSSGGAVMINGEDCVIRECNFIGTEAKTYGGAVYVNKDRCYIFRCTFEGCKTLYDDGGAIYMSDDVDKCRVEECKFKNCSSADCGGAIEYGEWSDNNKVLYCTFENCTSGDDGGAIDLSYDSDGFYVFGCTFIGCNADGDGGAINICQQCDDCRIEASTFDDCHALDGRGGGIFLAFGVARCNIVECDFSNCSADGDGDYVLGDGDTVIKDCTPKTTDDDLFEDCEFEFSSTGSVLSEGNLWIIIVVAVVAVGGVAALFIVKKKKKPALADGTENTGEE